MLCRVVSDSDRVLRTWGVGWRAGGGSGHERERERGVTSVGAGQSGDSEVSSAASRSLRRRLTGESRGG